MDKNYKLKTGKVEEKVVNTYKKIEDGVVGVCSKVNFPHFRFEKGTT